MQKLSNYLVICVALSCEARPLLDFYQLKKDIRATVFDLYCHRELPLALLVTGVGKLKMAAAVAWVYQYLGLSQEARYINIGIAGSRHFSLGDVIIAEKIIDSSAGRVYFPFIADQPFDRLACVSSYDRPVSEYPEQGVVDMEAAAFFVSAGLFVTIEHLLCIKIVSDTPLHSCHSLSKSDVMRFIDDRMVFIDGRIQSFLSKISNAQSVLTNLQQNFESLIKRWHFTEYQKNSLRQLLRRWHVLVPDENPVAFCYHQPNSAKVLELMMQRLACLEYQW